MMITGKIENDITFVSVTGDIDMFNSKIFKEDLYAQLWKKDTGAMRIDMREVNYMDSSGLGVLFAFAKMMKKNRKMIWITNLNDKIKNVIVLAGMDKMILGEPYESSLKR